MCILLLLSLVGQFLTIEVTGEGRDKVTINVPKELAEVGLEYARESSECSFRINDMEIPPDSLLKLLQDAGTSDEPILEIEEDGEVVTFWVNEGEKIVKSSKKPSKLLIDIEGEDNSLCLRLPLWLARTLPSFIVARGENAEEVKKAKELVREVVSMVEELEGGFTLIEINDEKNRVRIAFE